MTVPAPPRASRGDSMSLLADLSRDALDPGYAERSERRRAAGQPTGSVRSTPVLVIGVALVGLLLATAAAQVRARSSVTESTRHALVAQVRERTAAVDRLQDSVEDLRSQTRRTRDDALALTATGTRVAQELAALETVVGATAVHGPGVVVTLNDAAEATPGPGDPRQPSTVDDGRVRDTDLQQVANGLWAAGAEAVAINGQRLTSLSAIRAAGEAILVSYRQLTPPYVLTAVGKPATLRSNFRANAGGAFLHLLEEGYGISSTVEEHADVTVPAAGALLVRRATPSAAATPERGAS